MEERKKVSIIVPVYNSEKYLKKCIDSIVNQTYKNIEIILIDDGSEDNSLNICKDYSKRDVRIKVFHIEGRGVSYTRNLGIKKSCGDYIQFVDSDDYIEEEMCERLVESSIKNSSSLVICGNNMITTSGVIKVNCIDKTINSIKEIEKDFSELYLNLILNSPCNKLYKREVIKTYFDENIDLGEDLIFNLDNLGNAKKVTFINEQLYNYVKHNGNTLTLVKRENIMDSALMVFKRLLEFCDKYNIEEEYRYSIFNKLIDKVVIQTRIYIRDDKSTSEDIKRNIKSLFSKEEVKLSSKRCKFEDMKMKMMAIMIRKQFIGLLLTMIKFKKILKMGI